MENIALPLLGGAFIGLAASLVMLFSGRIAGVSGIVGDLATAPARDFTWRVAFLAGLVAGPVVVGLLFGRTGIGTPVVGTGTLIAAGLLVGLGTNIGGGCTSGHGVCGVSRLSARSLAATASFMVAAGATVFLVNHVM